MKQEPPIIGAAVSILDLKRIRPWLLEKQRDLELQDFVFASVLNGDWESFVNMARGMLDGYSGRLGIHGPFSGFEIDTRDHDVRTIVAKRMDQALDVCQALGAVQMVVHSPYNTWDRQHLDLKPRSRIQKIEAVHACMGAAVKRAENQGVTIVIENIQDIDPQDRKTLADSFESKAVQLSVDVGHAQYMENVNGAPSAESFIDAAGGCLGHLHLQDTDGMADRHWTIGQGTQNWEGVFGAISRLNVQPRLILELNDTAGITTSMAYLEQRGLAQ